MREAHTPPCKCPSCLSVCISALGFTFLYYLGKKCSLGFPVERSCLFSSPSGPERFRDQRKENSFPSLHGLKLWVPALSDRSHWASLRKSAFQRACPPPTPAPPPLSSPPSPSLRFLLGTPQRAGRDPEDHGCSCTPPHPHTGLSPWSVSGGPRWDGSIGVPQLQRLPCL